MNLRSSSRALVLAIGVLLLSVPVVHADTCCANAPVGLDPVSAVPGASVRVTGLRCLNADNSGPRPLTAGAFWLWPGERAADPYPDTTPGEGLPADLPPIEEWPSFDSLTGRSDGSGDAVITVPALPAGTYQLWWWCDGSGPGGGIHYSTGDRLTIVAAPDTATSPLAQHEVASSRDWVAWLLLGLGTTAFVWAIRFSGPGRGLRGSRGPSAE